MIGIVEALRNDNEVYGEFDECAGTRTCFAMRELELISSRNDPTGNIDTTQADKGL